MSTPEQTLTQPVHRSAPGAGLEIAVLIPCYNEAVTIGRVVADFRAALPDATVYVYDNNSSDGTAAVAADAGAVVRAVRPQGKGHVIRRMFSDIEADVYLLVDGDDTYDAAAAPDLVQRLLEDELDMVVAVREDPPDADAYPFGHRLGNRLLTGTVGWMFDDVFTDMLSGYRAFSRRFVKSFPALATGFETETELTIHALELRMPVGEEPTAYTPRPVGSESKLSTYRDGFRILFTILRLYEAERPLQFFSIVAALLATTSVVLAIPLLRTYLETGLVPRFPTAFLAASIMVLAVLAFTSGIVLETVTRGRREMKRLFYLSHPGPGSATRDAEGA